MVSTEEARKSPNNLILFYIFTFCEVYYFAFLASKYDPTMVMEIAGMMAAVLGSLYYYAHHTKAAFTVDG